MASRLLVGCSPEWGGTVVAIWPGMAISAEERSFVVDGALFSISVFDLVRQESGQRKPRSFPRGESQSTLGSQSSYPRQPALWANWKRRIRACMVLDTTLAGCSQLHA